MLHCSAGHEDIYYSKILLKEEFTMIFFQSTGDQWACKFLLQILFWFLFPPQILGSDASFICDTVPFLFLKLPSNYQSIYSWMSLFVDDKDFPWFLYKTNGSMFYL